MMGSIKELIDYLLNVVKFWIIVNPWERAIRVRFGKNQKLLKGGVHFRIPFLDNFYIQCIRLRVVALSMQTLTSKDIKTVTLNGVAGYEITNIETLYNTMLYPESTISNIIQGELAAYIYSHDIVNILPEEIEKSVMTKLGDLNKYGIKVSYFKLTNFAIVRTYRLIQDHSWFNEGIKLTESK
jgi:regulator of protease activity HflC (stomatin/prohibitin superfamily)